jgi:hypothetical protein
MSAGVNMISTEAGLGALLMCLQAARASSSSSTNGSKLSGLFTLPPAVAAASQLQLLRLRLGQKRRPLGMQASSSSSSSNNSSQTRVLAHM